MDKLLHTIEYVKHSTFSIKYFSELNPEKSHPMFVFWKEKDLILMHWLSGYCLILQDNRILTQKKRNPLWPASTGSYWLLELYWVLERQRPGSTICWKCQQCRNVKNTIIDSASWNEPLLCDQSVIAKSTNFQHIKYGLVQS